MSTATRSRDALVPLLVVGVLGIMVMPLPALVLDALLAINITISLAIMMTAMHVEKPLDFSAFPSLLLVTTLFRLGLNVATTRLILVHGSDGTDAAGKVIETFGQFVVGGNYVVGFVIFLILIVINFSVITKGSGRIAEVAARFALDALPGKQMAVDAELAAGAITQEQAQRKREQLAQETDFHGAMDGANKFVRGDAIAGLIITGINIVGGLVIGMTQAGMDLASAAKTYTVLTIGDGLVTQIPALVISTAAGLIVTRASDGRALGNQVVGQLLGNPKVLRASSAISVAMGFIPGLPLIPFFALGGGLWAMAKATGGRDTTTPHKAATADTAQKPKTEEEQLRDVLGVDPVVLEVGVALVPLVVEGHGGGEVLDRVTAVRKQLAKELGVILPRVAYADNPTTLGAGDYRVLIHGVPVATGNVLPDRLMAIDSGEALDTLDGIPGKDPTFGVPALWIASRDRERAEYAGYTVVEPATVVSTHLAEILRDSAAELLGRQELQELVDVVAKRSPRVVDDLVPGLLGYPELLAVCRALLREKVSIRDLRSVLEVLGEAARTSKSLPFLVEQVRMRLGGGIVETLKEPDGQLYAAITDPQTEEVVRGALAKVGDEMVVAADLATAQGLLGAIQRAMETLSRQGKRPVMVVPQDLRAPLRRFVQRFLPQVVVLSHSELPTRLPLQTVCTVSMERKAKRAVAPFAPPVGQAQEMHS